MVNLVSNCLNQGMFFSKQANRSLVKQYLLCPRRFFLRRNQNRHHLEREWEILWKSQSNNRSIWNSRGTLSIVMADAPWWHVTVVWRHRALPHHHLIITTRAMPSYFLLHFQHWTSWISCGVFVARHYMSIKQIFVLYSILSKHIGKFHTSKFSAMGRRLELKQKEYLIDIIIQSDDLLQVWYSWSVEMASDGNFWRDFGVHFM